MMSDNTALVNKRLFVERVTKQLLELFERSKAGEKLSTEKAKLEGFMDAGKVLEIITHSEGLELMDKAHVEVFGETMAERKANRGRVHQALDADDFEYLEIPAIERRK